MIRSDAKFHQTYVSSIHLGLDDSEKEYNRLLKEMVEVLTVCCQEKSKITSQRCHLLRQLMLSLSVEYKRVGIHRGPAVYVQADKHGRSRFAFFVCGRCFQLVMYPNHMPCI